MKLRAISIGCMIAGSLAFILYYTHANHVPIKTVPFDLSMQIDVHNAVVSSNQGHALLNRFKKIYEACRPDKVEPAEQMKIPPYIHVIWLGGKLPDEYDGFYKSWVANHPTWTTIFWTDNPMNYDRGDMVVRTFDEVAYALQTKQSHHLVVDVAQLSFGNRDMYDDAINYGEKSDILKWEVVYRFGGTYVDTDFESLQPLDPLHYRYDFYTGLQSLDTNQVQLGAALYGAIPGHPILRACVDNMRQNKHIPQIVLKTGPLHFTKVLLQTIDTAGLCDVVFPASYFYPCSYEQRGKDKSVWHKPEAFAVHHWAGSWLKPEGFVSYYMSK